MAEAVLHPDPQLLPPGQQVKVYAVPGGAPAGWAPAGAALSEPSVAANGSLTVTGLAEGTTYVAVSAADASRSLRFSPAQAQVVPGGSGLVAFGDPAADSLSVFAPDPGAQFLTVKSGTAAAPDATYSPLLHLSRTLQIPESAFSGDGAPGLSAAYFVTKATATSQGQAVGVYGGGITDGTNVGAHSLADAVGGYFVGRSTAVSTRTGMGVFASGRRESENGIATGMEVTADNETATSGTYNPKGITTTKALHVHATGTANIGAGIHLGKPNTATMEVGVGIQEGAVTGAGFRDDSSSLRAFYVKGSHAKGALVVGEGAGQVVIGADESATASAILDVIVGAAADPLAQFGTAGAFSVSVTLIRNNTGNAKVFASNVTNGFVTGTAQGDTGLAFTPGKTFHVGAQGKTSQLRVAEAGLGFFGHAPAAQPAKPEATAAAIITALESIGIFA